MNPLFFKPGEQLKVFKIFRKKSERDNKGRVTYTGEAAEVGELKGSISTASQKEIIRWKQLEHPISHIIVVYGGCDAQAEDILVIQNNKYYIQGLDNPGEMGFFHIIYCEKRLRGEGVGMV